MANGFSFRPLENAISKHELKLRATDSANQSVTESLILSVQQHKYQRSANHEIAVTVNLLERFPSNADWQIRLIKGIESVLGDASNVLVRDVINGINDPNTATLIYTNESLPRDQCPEEKLGELSKVSAERGVSFDWQRLMYRRFLCFQHLTVDNLSEAVSPQMSIRSITAKPIGQCSIAETTPPIVVKPTPHLTKNHPPLPRNQVDRVNASIGRLLVYKVPPVSQGARDLVQFS